MKGVESSVSEAKGMWRWIFGSSMLASMCCFPSVVLVAIGLISTSEAVILSNRLYWGVDGYGWFKPTLYSFTLVMLIFGLMRHFRRGGICDLDAAKREKNRILNTSLVVLISTLILFLLWNYIILEAIGLALGIPWEGGAFWL